MEYKKAEPIKLRDAGKDEKWLQDQINDDPSILGLGELFVVKREKLQFAGGRIDFVLSSPEDDSVRYETEIMLGKLNESHIIRAIEYWDVERRRYPSFEHKAIIVAEDITNRFFNVIGLMNKSIPIIAIQLNAFKFENFLFLNFVKILDLTETVEEEDEPQDKVDRKYWEKRSNPNSMAVSDAIIGMVKTIAEPRVTYNKGHIAIGTAGRNFLWSHPRKEIQHIMLRLQIGEDRDSFIKRFLDQGIQCVKARHFEKIRITLTLKELETNKGLIQEAINIAEGLSQ